MRFIRVVIHGMLLNCKKIENVTFLLQNILEKYRMVCGIVYNSENVSFDIKLKTLIKENYGC